MSLHHKILMVKLKKKMLLQKKMKVNKTTISVILSQPLFHAAMVLVFGRATPRSGENVFILWDSLS